MERYALLRKSPSLTQSVPSSIINYGESLHVIIRNSLAWKNHSIRLYTTTGERDGGDKVERIFFVVVLASFLSLLGGSIFSNDGT